MFAVLEIDEERVVTVIEVIDAEDPLMGGATVLLRPDRTDIQSVVVGGTVTVALGIIVDPVVNDLVLATRGGEGLTTVENPGRTEAPARGEPVHRYKVDVMPTVVVGIIPASAVDTLDPGLRPCQGIAYPTCETAVVLPGKELYTVGLAISRQNKTFDLDLTAEGLAIAVVEDILDLAVIALDGEVVGLVGRGEKDTATDLVGHLRFDDITADGIAVEGCRGALVAQGMDVLRGPRIGRLDIQGRGEGEVQTDTGLPDQVRLDNLVFLVVIVPVDLALGGQVVVERTAQRGEGTQAQTGRGCQSFEGLQGGIQPGGILPGPALLFLVGAEDLPFSGFYIQQRGLQTGLEVVGTEGDVKVLAETQLTDMTFVPEVEFHEVDAIVVLVTAVEQGRLGIGTAIEMMEPLQTARQVAPTDVDHVLQGRAVITCEEGQEELVAGGQRPVELRIDIVEIEGVVAEVFAELEEGIEIGATGSDEHRQFVLDERTLDGAFGRQQTDGGAAMPLLFVAGAAADVEDGGGGTAILRGQQTFIECGTGQGIVVEGGEEAGQMTDIVDRTVVEQYHVLGRRAAADLETARGIALGLDARQQLDAAHDVGLAEQLRGGGQFLQLELFGTGLYALQALAGRVRRDNDLFDVFRTECIGIIRGRQQG